MAKVATATVSLGGTQKVPYLAIYDLPADVITPQPSEFEGLDFAYRLCSEGIADDHLTTCWSSRDAWYIGDKRLRKVAGVGRPALHGYVHDLKCRVKPLWKRLHLYTWLLGVAAMLGALDAIGNHYEYLFARPSVFFDVKDPLHIDTIEGSNFSATVRMANQTHVEHRDLLILRATLQPLGIKGTPPTLLTTNPQAVSALSPGSAVDIELAGKAPKAGRYQLQLDVSGKAGHLVPEGNFHPTHPVRIWPKTPKVDDDWKLQQRGPDYARIDATLSIGSEAPHGVDCVITIAHYRSDSAPILDYFDSSNETWKWDYNTPGEERGQLQWHGPIAVRSEKNFSCSIPIIRGADLASLRKEISISCYTTEGG